MSDPDTNETLTSALRGTDATVTTGEDAAQAEWEASDRDIREAPADDATATGADPAELSSPLDEVPAEDLPGTSALPESQGADPSLIDLGPDGEGDLSPGDDMR
ncbi:sugar ABC transporter ATPase [Microbacterium sp. NPDC077184]|uniref:sugar ABC transporter ATPase n=1 Tax=Microbacterium sp. NPDC077184 TaxID=3154764 RepID=UPI00341CA76A